MTLSNRWDPYDVWNRLLHDNPVSVEDPAHSTGAMDASTAREFWASVADYPDPLQDALFVIAHARGFLDAHDFVAFRGLVKSFRDQVQLMLRTQRRQSPQEIRRVHLQRTANMG